MPTHDVPGRQTSGPGAARRCLRWGRLQAGTPRLWGTALLLAVAQPLAVFLVLAVVSVMDPLPYGGWVGSVTETLTTIIAVGGVWIGVPALAVIAGLRTGPIRAPLVTLAVWWGPVVIGSLLGGQSCGVDLGHGTWPVLAASCPADPGSVADFWSQYAFIALVGLPLAVFSLLGGAAADVPLPARYTSDDRDLLESHEPTDRHH